MSEHEAWPLDWPPTWPRTKTYNRRAGNFTTNLGKARDHLLRQVELLGGRNLIISSNVPLRQDGLPYADYARRDIGDPGVAIYFQWKGTGYTMACDKFGSVQDNMRAVGLTIASIRALERYGASQLMERAFSGFAALPAPMVMGFDWRKVLECEADSEGWTIGEIESRFRRLAHERHPDVGGSTEAMAELNRAREEALREIAS